MLSIEIVSYFLFDLRFREREFEAMMKENYKIFIPSKFLKHFLHILMIAKCNNSCD